MMNYLELLLSYFRHVLVCHSLNYSRLGYFLLLDKQSCCDENDSYLTNSVNDRLPMEYTNHDDVYHYGEEDNMNGGDDGGDDRMDHSNVTNPNYTNMDYTNKSCTNMDSMMYNNMDNNP